MTNNLIVIITKRVTFFELLQNQKAAKFNKQNGHKELKKL